MCKHGGTPSGRDKHVTLAAISPPGVARGLFVGGQQSGLAGRKPPPFFMRGTSSCPSQGRRQGERWGAPPRPSAPTYLPPFASGGTNFGSAVWVPGRRPPTSHTPATSAGNSTRYPLQRRRAATGVRSAPRWPRAPRPNNPRALTAAQKRRLCTGASGAHTPPHTAARAPRAPPSCGSTCTCGTPRPSRSCGSVRTLTPAGRRALQSPQHHALPTRGRAGARDSPPSRAGGGRPGPGGGRGNRGARGTRCRPARPCGQRECFSQRGRPPGHPRPERSGGPYAAPGDARDRERGPAGAHQPGGSPLQALDGVAHVQPVRPAPVHGGHPAADG